MYIGDLLTSSAGAVLRRTRRCDGHKHYVHIYIYIDILSSSWKRSGGFCLTVSIGETAAVL